MRFKSMPISPVLRKNLARMGYEEPTPIQEDFLEPALAGHDAIGLAKTGTGKTTAFLLPILERLIATPPSSDPSSGPAPRTSRSSSKPRSKGASRAAAYHGDTGRAERRLRALVLCPTRELAIQVAKEASQLLRGSGLRELCVHGKVAITPQAEALARGVDLVIGTPGRIRELLEAKAIDLRFVRTVVLDEADRMLDMGFEPQVREILAPIPGDRQTLLLSATMPPIVDRLVNDLLRRPVRVEVDPSTTPVTHVRQRVIGISDDLKVPLLLALLGGADGGPTGGVNRAANRGGGSGGGRASSQSASPERHGVLVFCRTRRRAGWISTALKRNRIAVGSLHGDKSHAQRTRALSRFVKGEYRVLVATDVASRGLHIEAVQCVVSYDLPTAPEEHVHRIGRAAHGLEGRGGYGEAIVLLSPEEEERWTQILPLVGEATKPERPPRLDAFLVHAPPRTQRAAAGPSKPRTKSSSTEGSTTDRSTTRRGTKQAPKEPAGDAKPRRQRGPEAKRVEPKRGLKKRGRKSVERPRKAPRVGTGVRRPEPPAE